MLVVNSAAGMTTPIKATDAQSIVLGSFGCCVLFSAFHIHCTQGKQPHECILCRHLCGAVAFGAGVVGSAAQRHWLQHRHQRHGLVAAGAASPVAPHVFCVFWGAGGNCSATVFASVFGTPKPKEGWVQEQLGQASKRSFDQLTVRFVPESRL